MRRSLAGINTPPPAPVSSLCLARGSGVGPRGEKVAEDLRVEQRMGGGGGRFASAELIGILRVSCLVTHGNSCC